ncbi:MAG: hypothetical protein ABSB24_07175 [Gaiellaceae bacterium]
MRFGAAVLVDGLRELGYVVDETPPPNLGVPAGHVFVRLKYRIRFGSRAGEEVTIGFLVPADFPASAPGGVYVYPSLRPLSQESTLPDGGVSDQSQTFGEQGWQHWSRPHDAWAASERNAKAWMAHVHRLFIHL